MVKTIVQEVVFENTTPDVLYNLYMNAEKHSMIAGAPAEITDTVGSNFSAHGGYIKGKNIHLVKDKVIVQTWRPLGWEDSDADSIFSIHLEQQGNDVVLHATHSNIPEKFVAGVEKGWNDHYWNPWKQHIAGEEITRPVM